MYNGDAEQEYSESGSEDEDREGVDVFSNPNLLFKLSISCNSKHKTWDFQVVFLNFEAMELFVEKEALNLIFPMSVEELGMSITQTMDVMAVEKDKFKGSCTFNVAEQIEGVLSRLRRGDTDYPISVRREDKGKLIGLDGKPVGEIEVQFEFSCIGPNLIQEMETKAPEEGEGEVLPEPDDYDEYSAEINGHSLSIRMLRKKKGPTKDLSCHCPSSMQARKLKGIPPGGVGRKNSQIIFQMPNNSQLCKKTPQNAMMYNVGTCPQMEAHGHGAEQIKVLSGNSDAMESEDKTDTFVIRIGKKTPGVEGKGRLELELKAPKPMSAIDFKKTCRDIGMQTDKSKK